MQEIDDAHIQIGRQESSSLVNLQIIPQVCDSVQAKSAISNEARERP